MHWDRGCRKGPAAFTYTRCSMCKCPVCGKARQVKKVNNLLGVQFIQSRLEGSGSVMRTEILLLT